MSDTHNDDKARAYMHKLLATMSEAGGSDLFIANDFPPSMKAHGNIRPLASQKLTGQVTRDLAYSIMNARQREEFEREKECNFAIALTGISRFRVNVFVQQQHVGMVVRTIATEIPTFEKLGLPDTLAQIVMNKRGLVLVVGATGSGKSTSLAAMLDHRNRTASGHIITIEDPVEYVHESKGCLVTHREVGVDTHSWHHALKNTLRQAPDVILIGEIRDAETMEHAIAFAETGHLCLGTLHANNANQTLDRIINFFPEERRNQLLMDLSANLRAIVSQRLVRMQDGEGRKAAVEILLNTPTIAERIFKGEFHELKTIMGRSRELGMRTFDWALFELYNDGHISYEEAIRNADSANELRLNIKLRSPRGEPATSSGLTLSIDAEPTEEERLQEMQRQQVRRRQVEQERLVKLDAERKQKREQE
ncbi:MAG TPA: PilT/PilU family type 4a pilus ATPase, partial [Casimicrobiaceae bacterium]|nr:PilT/PilU family type 4a pilus ATPase [Casimicrobiaceae bacterium]